MADWGFKNENCRTHLVIYQTRSIVYLLCAVAIITLNIVSMHRLISHFKKKKQTRSSFTIQIIFCITCIIFAILFPLNLFLHCYGYVTAAKITFVILYTTYYLHWILLISTYFVGLYQTFKELPRVSITKAFIISSILSFIIISTMPFIVIFWFSNKSIMLYASCVIISLLLVVILTWILSSKFSFELHKAVPRRESAYNTDKVDDTHLVARKIYCLAMISTLSTFIIMCISSFLFVAPHNEIWWTLWQFMVLMDVLVDTLCILLAIPNCKSWYLKLCGCIDKALKSLICDKIDYAKLAEEDNF